ncbi:glycerophosphodiester phosphodiesterase [Clostridia bacterium]|nr:glycerophosphodiester phosphodiesterase [Clostridia bacterium]
MLIFFIFALLLGYVFLIFPGKTSQQQIQLFTSWDYAHRGLHNQHKGIPENSIAAIQNAVKHGYGIEFDVQMTKDKQIVVFHDMTLKRVCHQKLWVQDCTYEQLQNYSILGTKERIPLLSEALSAVKGKVPLLIEIKSFAFNGEVCNLLEKELSQYEGDYCIESFNPFILSWYKKHRKEIFRGQLSSPYLWKELGYRKIWIAICVANLLSNFVSRPHFISYAYHGWYHPSFILLKKVWKIPTFGWTFNNSKSYKKYKKRYHSVIFEGFVPARRENESRNWL